MDFVSIYGLETEWQRSFIVNLLQIGFAALSVGRFKRLSAFIAQIFQITTVVQ